jgi:non-specific serine/threonine protein kinase
MGASLHSDEHSLYGPYLYAARVRFGAEAWKGVRAEGRAMTLEKPIEHALSELEAATSVCPAPEQLPAVTQTLALTRRQQEIATLGTRGLTNRQIASELSISEDTAAAHVAKILKELGLRSRTQIGSWLADREAL